MARLMNRRRRLKTVIAVLLFWQLGGAVAGVSAMASPVPAQGSAEAAPQHCQEHATARVADTDVSRSQHTVLQGQTGMTPGDPPCCQGDCPCVGGQGPPVVTGALTPRLVQTDHQVIGEQHSPHVVSRITEFFRPPI